MVKGRQGIVTRKVIKRGLLGVLLCQIRIGEAQGAVVDAQARVQERNLAAVL